MTGSSPPPSGSNGGCTAARSPKNRDELGSLSLPGSTIPHTLNQMPVPGQALFEAPKIQQGTRLTWLWPSGEKDRR